MQGDESAHFIASKHYIEGDCDRGSARCIDAVNCNRIEDSGDFTMNLPNTSVTPKNWQVMPMFSVEYYHSSLYIHLQKEIYSSLHLFCKNKPLKVNAIAKGQNMLIQLHSLGHFGNLTDKTGARDAIASRNIDLCQLDNLLQGRCDYKADSIIQF